MMCIRGSSGEKKYYVHVSIIKRNDMPVDTPKRFLEYKNILYRVRLLRLFFSTSTYFVNCNTV